MRKSQSDIAGTALKALERSAPGEERTAVILGAGNCFDIPLPQLVSEFDRTTLVDVNTKQTEQALCSLPPNLLGKVVLIRADVSGAMKGYYDAFGQAMEEKDYRRFQEVAAALVGRLDVVKSQVNFGEKYNFVCSQLLMTQLGSVPTTNLGELSAKKYGSNFLAEPDKAAELSDVVDRQILNIQKAHIGHLRSLTKDRGTVHFADTVAKIEGSNILPMLKGEALDAIDDHFNMLRSDNYWHYVATPQHAFAVMSYSLAPKIHEDVDKQ